MKAALLLALLASAACAQTLSFYVDTSNGAQPYSQLQSLQAAYSMPDTPVGSSSSVVLRVVNTSLQNVTLNYIYVSAAAGSMVSTQDFTVTASPSNFTLVPQAWKDFTVNFTPTVTGSLSGYLEAVVNGNLISISTLTGNGTPSQITLSCSAPLVTKCDGSLLQPAANLPIYFGNILATVTAPVTFTLTNNSATAFNAQSLITISTTAINPNTPFTLSGVPAMVAPGTSAKFTVTFSPGDTNTYETTLNVGANSYLIQGAGVTSTIQGAAVTGMSFYVDTSNGAQPYSELQSLQDAYALPDTPVGSSSSVVLRAVNISSQSIVLNNIYVGTVAGSSVNTPNFTLTGLPLNSTLAPQGWKNFTVNFTPTAIGPLTSYLQAQVNGTGTVIAVSSLTGNGTAAAITLSCSAPAVTKCDGSLLQPAATSPIYFGNVLTTATAPVTFTLTNNSATAVNAQSLISISTPTNNLNTPFALSGVPATVAPGTTATFTVTFAPGDTSTYQTTLNVGANSYLIQGAGTASTIGDLSSLDITYTDSDGVRGTAQPLTAVNFGHVVAGTSGTVALTFTVSNSDTTILAVTVPALAVTGAGFSITGAPPLPASIPPGSSITFQVVFSGNTTGTYTGTLAIGTRLFSLTAQSITSPLPDITFQLDQPTLTSAQQVHLTVQLASASTVSAIGTLTMQFTPSVSGIIDDPAINFTTTAGRNLQISVANAGQTATYNNQSAITFQTGTTAGTLTLTATFPNKAPYSKSFTITPAQITIATGKAVRQTPNLVVTVSGYDNTYTAGKLSYNFYDTSGKLLNATPIPVDATSAFHTYFYTTSKVGGAFSVQASFPVTGIDVSQVGKVAVNLTNSAGTTSVTQAFQ